MHAGLADASPKMTSRVTDALLVLVISEQAEMAARLRAILAAAFQTELTAPNDALARLQRPPAPALVLLDMLHPSVQEFDLLSRIRSVYPEVSIRTLPGEDPSEMIQPDVANSEGTRFLQALERCIRSRESVEHPLQARPREEGQPPMRGLSIVSTKRLGDAARLPEEACSSAADKRLPFKQAHGLKSLLRNLKGEAERTAIAQALDQTHWNRTQAARLLNISYRTLLYKIHQYGLGPAIQSSSRPSDESDN
jgi:DNA-binding NtrC family response regulator